MAEQTQETPGVGGIAAALERITTSDPEGLLQARNQRIQQLIRGVPSWDEYLRVAGEIRGIELAIQHTEFPAPRRPANGRTTTREARP